jgi:hypothetical protein
MEMQMKFIKLISLVGSAAIAAMALLGAASAQASPHELIGFCGANEPVLCAAPLGGTGTKFLATSPNVVLKNNGFFSMPEECDSKIAFEVEAVDQKELNGKITEAMFLNCRGPCPIVTAVGLPWKFRLKMTETLSTKYTLTVESGGILLSGCTFGTSCTYSVPAGGITLQSEDTATGTKITAAGVSLKYKEGSGEFVCGSSVGLTATYESKEADLSNGTKHPNWSFTLLGTA